MNTLSFNNLIISCFLLKDDIWFKGKDIATGIGIFGYL